MSGGSRTQTVKPWEAQVEPLKYGFGEARKILDKGPAEYYPEATTAGFDPAQQAAQAATLGYTMAPRTQSMMKGAENALIGSLQGATPFTGGQMSDLLAGRVDTGGGPSLPAGVSSLGYYSSCFVDGVQVELVDGSEKNVSEINIGDEVKTDKGDGVVTKIYPSKAGGQKLYGFNGKEPFVTEAHPFMTQDGWKKISDVVEGDILYRNGKGIVTVESVISKEIPEDTPVYNFHVDGHETYFADGYLVHNKTYAPGYEPGGPHFVPGTGPGPVSGPSGGGGSPYADMMQTFGNQMKSQLLGNVLPGIRSGIVEAHPGGSSVANNIQSKAIAAANQQMTNKAAEMYGNAYAQAQGMRMPAAQMQLGQQALGMQQYPSIMAQPFSVYDRMGDIGDKRQAMSQRAIDDDISRYTYSQQAPQNALQNYMAMISGDYGSTTTAPGPSGLDTVGKLASIASIFM